MGHWMKAGTLMIATCVLAGVQAEGPCTGCSPTNAKGEWELRFDIPFRSVPIPNDVLVIELEPLPPRVCWHLGVRAAGGEAGSAARLQAAELVTERMDPVGFGVPREVTAYQQGEVASSPGWARVTLRPGGSGRHAVVYAELPRRLTVEVRVNRETIVKTAVVNSLHLSNGAIVPSERATLPSLMIQATQEGVKSVRGVQLVGGNTYVASADELVKNLAEFVRPPRYPGRDVPPGSSVSFTVKISADGEVTEVTRWRGNERPAEHCRPVLLRWRFLPFKYNAAPVSAEAGVLMVLDANGDILVPTLQAR